jgi:hypothetical protein
MKKYLSYLSICLYLIVVLFNSCEKDKFDESIPINPVLTPIKAVTSIDGNGKIVYATISDKDRTIHLDFQRLKSLSKVNLELSVSKRAKLISPTDTIVTLDLTKPYPIVINNLYDDLTYTLTASIPEIILADKSLFKEFKLNNDTPMREGNIINLWDGQAMSAPEKYDEIGWRNYHTGECFTVDIGEYYNLYRFKTNLYWAYTNVCPKIYELWGYLGEGEPPVDGEWDKWTKLGTINNSTSTLADFAEGDMLEFSKEKSPLVRYIRVKCLENYRNPASTNISLCEITFWAYNI